MTIPRLLLGPLLATVVTTPLHAAFLPDTGQTLCDDGSNTLVACSDANTGDASTMPGQDGRYGRDPAAAAGRMSKVGGGAAGLDYIKMSNSGTYLPATAPLGAGATDWACNIDLFTGLEWEVKVSDGGLRDVNWVYSWYNSNPAINGGVAGVPDSGIGVGSDACFDPARCDTEKYVADVNAAGLCGKSDWRVPSKRELESLLYFGGGSTSHPYIDPNYFPASSNFGGEVIWSASTVSSAVFAPDGSFAYANGLNAWAVSFSFGGVSSVHPKSVFDGPTNVMLVRGAPF
ncbi:MAG: DUF1566 domain-containing protein [Chromatiales bacterium]|nr:DUF1566 domain-containing protein [Chromatiales bacterium]